MQIKSQQIHAILIIVLSVLVYANTFSNPFVWDDYDFIVGRDKITSFEYVPYFFTHPTVGNLWRPLRELWYITMYDLWELNPWGYHLSALMLHILICLLLYGITKEILGSKVALIAALLFAAHPLHTERVTNMTGSFDLVGLVFYAASVYLFILFRKQGSVLKYGASLVLYGLALLSSEEAITLMGIIVLYDVCFTESFKKKEWAVLAKQYGGFVILTLGYLTIRTNVVGQIGRSQDYLGNSFSTAMLSTVAALKNYFMLLIYPVHISIYRSSPKITSIFALEFILSIALLIVLGIALWRSFKFSKPLFFAGSWFFITMFLFYNTIPKPTLVADRYLYFPSFGFCVLLAMGIVWIVNHPRLRAKKTLILWGIVILIVGAYATIAIERNTHWSDRTLILQKAVEVEPLSSQSHWALGTFYRETGRFEEAFPHLLRAIELSSKNYAAYNELGILFVQTNQPEEAIPYLMQAIETFPSSEGPYYKGHNDLGLVYAELGEYDQAINYLKKAIEIHPEYAKAHHDLATVYARTGETTKAHQEFKIAISINPDEKDYQKNYAIFKNQIEKIEKNED